MVGCRGAARRCCAAARGAVEEFAPANVVIDPLSALNGEEFALQAMLSRLIDHFKARQGYGGDDDADPG